MKIRIPKGILRRVPKWHYIVYTRGSGQYPGGNPQFTGNQPPALLVPCEDGTCQRIDLDLTHVPHVKEPKE